MAGARLWITGCHTCCGVPPRLPSSSSLVLTVFILAEWPSENFSRLVRATRPKFILPSGCISNDYLMVKGRTDSIKAWLLAPIRTTL